MKKIKPVLNIIAAFVSLAMSVTAFAVDVLPSWDEFKQVRENGKSFWQLDIENDSLLFRDRDSFYTAGDRIGQSYTQADRSHALTYGWNVGQDLYTASDIKLTPQELSPIDHPYAAWLYARVFKEINEATGRSMYLGFDFGCFGACAGGAWFQTHLHRLIKQPAPQGWSTQLHNEWGGILTGEYSPGRVLPAAGIDIAPRFKAHFGNILTDASAEGLLRFGSLNSLPQQAASYGFSRAEVKAVAYNASIQGGYFNHQATTVRHKTLVGELEIGYMWRNDQYGLSASVVRRSNEIKELTNGQGAENFARLQFFYAM